MHISVLVIGGFVDEQLEPFQVECNEEYKTEFVPTGDEERAYYENPESKIGEVYQDDDGAYCLTWGPQSKRANELKEMGQPGLVVHISTIFPTFEEYAKAYDLEYDPLEGDYGYWDNPNGRWDWYEIGGRWKDVLVIKDDAQGYSGTWIHEKENPEGKPYKFIAQAFKKDVDWVMTYALERKRNERLYDEMEPEARDKWEYQGKTREDYVRNYSWLPIHSVLIDGEWQDSDEMNWSNMKGDDEEYKKWGQHIQSIIDRCDEDELLTIVDCHI
jgi:hypothetical protein